MTAGKNSFRLALSKLAEKIKFLSMASILNKRFKKGRRITKLKRETTQAGKIQGLTQTVFK
jgi:hypothetical protein